MATILHSLVSQDPPPTLAANLRVLRTLDAPLYERICLPVDGDHVDLEHADGPRYRIHRTWYPLALDEEAGQAALADVPDSGDVLLFGLGLGELLDACLMRDEGVVTAWDRDPWMLRLLLTHVDLRAPLMSERLRLKLGVDLLDELDADRPVVLHPFFAERYDNERRLLTDGLGERRALLCDGTLFVASVAEALRAEGLTVGTFEPERLAAEELQLTVKRWAPECVVRINHMHGLAEACAGMGVPLVVWEIDPSTDALRPCGRSTDHVRIFTWREALLEPWRAAGFHNVQYLPLAADPQARHPVTLSEAEGARYRAPVAFVGASMVAQGEAFRQEVLAGYVLVRGGSPLTAQDEGQLKIEAILGEAREDFAVDRTEELVERYLGDVSRAFAGRGRRLEPLIAEMIAAEKRITWVANLGQVDATVWGDDGWELVQQYGVRYCGAAGHKAELNKVYSGATINVDIGRYYQMDIVTMRVFDVMACGGFVLAEHSAALEALFERGVHLDWYSGLQELLDKVEYWLEQPDEAAAIGARARAFIETDHNIAARVRHMLASGGPA